MILLIIVTVLFLLTNRAVKDRISVIFIWSFIVLWVGQSVLSRFAIYDLNIPSDRTYTFVALHMLFFYAGFRFAQRGTVFLGGNSRDIMEKLNNGVERLISNRFFIVLLFFTLLYVLSLVDKYFSAVLMYNSITDARVDGQLEELYGPVYHYLKMLLISPMAKIVLLLFVIKSFTRRDWMWAIMGVFLIANESLGGGRFGYMKIFICLLFVAGIILDSLKTERNIFKKYKSILVLASFGVLVYALISLTTAGRMGEIGTDYETFQEGQETANMHLVTYFTGPIVAFDHSLQTHMVDRMGGYKYGALCLNPIEEFIYTIVQRIGITYERPIADYGHLFQEDYIDIGAMTWNALYTWCNFFYCDFGLLGLIFFPFVLGLLMRKIIFYFYNNCNVFSASIVLWMFVLIVYSPIKYDLNGLSSLIGLCVLFYLSKRCDGLKKEPLC